MLWRYISVVSDPNETFKDMDLGQCPGKRLHFHIAAVFLSFAKTDINYSNLKDTLTLISPDSFKSQLCLHTWCGF